MAPFRVELPLPFEARMLAAKELAEVPTLDPGHVFDKPDQVRARWRHRATTVCFVETFHFPEQRVAGRR